MTPARRALGFALVTMLAGCELPAPEPTPRPTPPPLEVKVRSVSRSRGGGNAEVMGSLENKGSRELASCTITVLFLDKDRKVIDRDTTYVNGLPGGQSQNWRALRPWDPRFYTASASCTDASWR